MLTIIIALIVFGLVVTVHEFGHFITAKLVGITVEEFSIGMGPQIFSKSSSGTKYSLRAIPLGGYVKMEGEDESSESEGSFSSKSIPKRMAVILAGAVMNFVLAYLVFVVYFSMVGTQTNSIGTVMEGTPAYSAGIEVNDEIKEINGNSTESWDDITKAIRSSGTDNLEIKVLSNNTEKVINAEVVEMDGVKTLGIKPLMEKSLVSSLEESFKLLFEMVKMMFDFIARALSGGVTTNEVSGPIGIYNVIGQAAKAGVIQIILITGFISVNLGFFNLLPIPALDGSRFLFLLIEAIRGKKIDPEKEGLVHLIGFFVLISFTIFITYKDILRLKAM